MSKVLATSRSVNETAPVHRKRFLWQGVLALAWLAPFIHGDEPYLDVACDYDTCWTTYFFEVRAPCGTCPGAWFAYGDTTWIEYGDHFTGPGWNGEYKFWLDLDHDGDVDMADMALYQPTWGDFGTLIGYFQP